MQKREADLSLLVCHRTGAIGFTGAVVLRGMRMRAAAPINGENQWTILVYSAKK